jgi:7-cyano-7-deazaguanine synthase
VADGAVLFSGGLDSAVLVASEARERTVHPLYVSTGLAWEPIEREAAHRLLSTAPFDGKVRPLVPLDLTVRDVYAPSHWAIRGVPPGYDTPDEDVYLVGRNLVLLTKAAIYCAQHGIERIALGPLAGNPFPDARPEFFAAAARALSLGLERPIHVEAPFLTLHKADVIRLGHELGVSFALTVSCMNPVGGVVHCGACSKCRERQQAFAEAGIHDPTEYRAR